jgi:hypothetical protein
LLISDTGDDIDDLKEKKKKRRNTELQIHIATMPWIHP